METLSKSLQKEKAEGNKLIVEVIMGGVRENHPILGWGYRFSGDDLDNPTWGTGVGFLSEKGLRFNYDWNLLMRAIAKVNDKIKEPTDKTGKMLYRNMIDGITAYFDIGLTFIETVNFIKWYKAIE